MRQSTQNTVKTNKSVCKSSSALINLLTGYDKEQVTEAFTDMDDMFKDWCDSEYADDRETRSQFLLSLRIITEFGAIVDGISTKKLKLLHKQMTADTRTVKEAV